MPGCELYVPWSVFGNATKNWKYHHDFYIEKQVSKKQVVSLRNTIALNSGAADNLSDQGTLIYHPEMVATALWKNRLTDNKSTQMLLNGYYGNELSDKLSFDVNMTFADNGVKPVDRLFINRNNTGVIRTAQFENSFEHRYQDYTAEIELYWKPKEKIAVTFGTAYQLKANHFDFPGSHQSFSNAQGYWLPSLTVRYKDFTISWSEKVESAATEGIQVQTDQSEPLYTRLQSFVTDNIVTRHARIEYRKYQQKYQFSAFLTIDNKDRSIGYQNWRNTDTGHETSQTYQSGPVTNYNGSVMFRYHFEKKGKWTYYTSSDVNSYTFQYYRVLNDNHNKVTVLGTFFTQEFSLNWNNLVGIVPKYELRWNRNLNTIQNNSDFSEATYKTHSVGIGLNINPVKRFSMETSYTLENRASGLRERQNYHILNTSLYYTLKNNSQLKLTGFDMLNQNNNNYWNTNSNNVSYSTSNTLKQYFLLGYIYKFKSVKQQ